MTKSVIPLLSLIIMFSLSSVAFAGKNEKEVKVGKELYKAYCVVCHGEKGKGDGVNSRNMDPAPRDFMDTGKEKYMVKRTEQELYQAIEVGGREIEKSALMPPFGNTLSQKEIWSIVAYISVLCETKSWDIDFSKKMTTKRPTVEVKTVEIPEPTRRDKMMGKRAYGKYGCSGCHEIRERGGESGPHLDGIGAKLKPQQIYAVIQNARLVKGDTAMPIYDLNKDTAISITKYLMLLE